MEPEDTARQAEMTTYEEIDGRLISYHTITYEISFFIGLYNVFLKTYQKLHVDYLVYD